MKVTRSDVCISLVWVYVSNTVRGRIQAVLDNEDGSLRIMRFLQSVGAFLSRAPKGGDSVNICRAHGRVRSATCVCKVPGAEAKAQGCN